MTVHTEQRPAERCYAMALMPGGHWKRCIRNSGHNERHVWLEAYERVGGRPRIVTWTARREPNPHIAEVAFVAEWEPVRSEP